MWGTDLGDAPTARLCRGEESSGLVALLLQGCQSHSARQDLPVRQDTVEYSHGFLEAFKEKCLRNIKFTLKPFDRR